MLNLNVLTAKSLSPNSDAEEAKFGKPAEDDATNRQLLYHYIDRFCFLVDCDDERDSSLKMLESYSDARMELPFTMEVFRDLALNFNTLSSASPFRFLTRLCEATDWCSTLGVILSQLGWTRHRASNKWGLNPVMLHTWMVKKNVPNIRSFDTVVDVATYLGVPSELLTSKISRFVHGLFRCRKGVTPFAARHGIMVRKRYLLHTWPDAVEKDWHFLVKHKTSPTGLGLKRNKIWRVKRGKVCHTAITVRAQLSRYFGFLLLPADHPDPHLRGMGFTLEDISFALLVDEDLVLAFLDFLEARAEKINEGQRYIITLFCSFLNRETGFITQQLRYADNPRLARKFSTDSRKRSHWIKRCSSAYERLKQQRLFHESQRLYKVGKNNDSIKLILEDSNPARFLVQLREGMRATRPGPNKCFAAMAIYVRDEVLVGILSNIPLRSDQLRHITYRADGTGNLYLHSTGCYHLRFAPDDFKHWAHYLHKDFDAPLPANMTSLIDEYLRVYRPHLADASTCDYLLRPSALYAHQGNANQPLGPDRVGIIVRSHSAKHLGHFTRGFAVHEFRDILAVTLVKRFSNGIDLAAKLLHCSRDMISEHYGQYQTSQVIGTIQQAIYDL